MTSERTINQVRAILNKLDRSIDEARERRTHPEPAAPQAAPAPDHVPAVSASPAPAHPGAAAGRANSPFGRAQPLNRPPSTPSWRQ
jgi:hypothetical protein